MLLNNWSSQQRHYPSKEKKEKKTKTLNIDSIKAQKVSHDKVI